MSGHGPRRIVCLTEEPTETLYLLGEDWRIVGISGFTVRPPEARREKPKVSAFTSARIGRILELRPDLVIGFSDLQAAIATELIQHGVEVWIANHRSVEGIMDYVLRLGGLVGRPRRAQRLVDGWRAALEDCARRAAARGLRPRVYFEEWDEPRISGIRWVSELVRIAGGEDIFPELAEQPLARGRILADDGPVFARDPEIMIASWCGKKFRPQRVAERPGWQRVQAVRTGELHEIPSSVILQPGPAALTDGLAALERIIAGWVERQHRR